MAADPTYPLYPVITLISSVLLLILLATNFVRHSWNLGITILCFWLFWENLFGAINSIIWADNVDIKLYVYCDIVTHLYVFTYVVKPACTLILTRRLYKIASLRSLVPNSRREKITDAFVEWSLGLGLPVVVTGVFYYIVQGARFEVYETIGCESTANPSDVEILLVKSPGVILPLISAIFYCPKIVFVFCRQSRDTNRFLQTNGSVSRSGYSRIFALGCLDIFLTLPLGIIQIASEIGSFSPELPLPWYDGWSYIHSDWEPGSVSWNDIIQGGTWTVFGIYFSQWSSVILAFAIFTLFGFTAEPRATYKRCIYATLKVFGWTPPVHEHEAMGELQFGIRSLAASGQTRTQESALPAVSRGRIEDRDAEQGLPSNARLDLEEEHKLEATRLALRSVSPNIGTNTIFQAEDSEPSESDSGDGESSNDSDEGSGTGVAANAHVSNSASGRENAGPPGTVHPPEGIEAARTA